MATKTPLRILLTGATGGLGSHTLRYLLKEGHSVLATDWAEVRPNTIAADALANSGGRAEFIKADLTSLADIDALFDAGAPALTAGGEKGVDGVIHLGAYPNPREGLDDRHLHSNNVSGSYNVLRTALDRGVKRAAQASSVNAMGLSYTPGATFDRLPVRETDERRPSDAYGLSKHVCEIQADGLVRWSPTFRVASIRPHMVREDYESAWPDALAKDIFSWVSFDACARACELGLLSEGWEGHEVFTIAAPEHCWEGTVEKQRLKGDPETNPRRPPTIELCAKYWPAITEIDTAYWAENPYRAAWDTTKAERILGWKHDL